MRSRLPKMTDEMIATLSVKETPADGSLRRRGGANLTFPQSGELRASDVLNVVAEILEQVSLTEKVDVEADLACFEG
ncbi:hypothetical protein ACOSP7_014317 [Xanthoceras sorbifolium]